MGEGPVSSSGSDSASDSVGASGHETETAVVGRPVSADPSGTGPAAISASLTSRYIVLEEIGRRGNDGCLVRAYDPKLQREVALAELRGVVAGEAASKRLVAEARAMAKLSHPNVVAIYDVREDPDQLVLVMEYLPGQTLRAWLLEEDRAWRDVLDRFVEAGRGLMAAHDVGLLHRSFEPGKVLVADDGSVKVTDFGLATAQDQIANLTPAADQHAFCVALWEALYGEPPFAGARAPSEGPPECPRSAVPRVIGDAVRRGLAPDPSQRWPSMEALLEVLAYDPDRGRRRLAVVGGGVVALGLVGVGWQLQATARAQRCTGAEQRLRGAWDEERRDMARVAVLATEVPYAEQVWERTAADLDRYASEWTAMHIEACEATTLRGEQSVRVMDLRMACLHRARMSLEAATDVLASADAEVVARAHAVMAGLRPLSRCADVAALQADVDPPMPAEADAVQELRRKLAALYAARAAGRYELAWAEVEDAKSKLEGLEYSPIRIEVMLAEGLVLEEIGDYPASEAKLRELLELAARARQWDDVREAAVQLMFVIGYRQQRMDEGLRYLELAEGLAKGNPRATWAAQSNHAAILEANGEYEQAESEFRRALALQEKELGPEDLEVAATRSNLGAVLFDQGKYAEAQAEHQRVLDLRIAALGPEHLDVASSLNNLAGCLASQGEFEAAVDKQRRALELQVTLLGPDHPYVAMSRNNLANMLSSMGDYEASAAEHRRAQKIWAKTLEPEHPYIAASRNNLGGVLLRMGKLEEAEAEYRSALAMTERTLGPEHADCAMARNNIASLLERRGMLQEAEHEYRRALSIWEAALGSDHPTVATSRANVAGILLARGRPEEALPLAEQAWKRSEAQGVPPTRKASIDFVLARALWATNPGKADRARSRALAEAALQAYEADGERSTEQQDELRQWLRTHGEK